MITHGNLLAQLGADPCRVRLGRRRSRGVFWLPLFHDMGLIGGVLQTLYCGGASTLFSPVSFLQRPSRWLEAISRTGATISGGAQLRLRPLRREDRRPSSAAGLDLSRWRVAFNGAEPIRAETLERFAEAFAPAGFRREAFLPCYGLAEATLLVSGDPTGRSPIVVSVDAGSLGRGDAVRGEPAPAPRCGWSAAAGRPRTTSSRSSTRRPSGPCPTTASARSGSRGRASRRATGAAPRRAGDIRWPPAWTGTTAARSSAPATSASSATASCSSPAGSRT